MDNELKFLFFQGNYQSVLAEQGLKFQDQQWVIGALSFTGRKEEAQALFAQLKNQMSEAAQTACRFYLGVAFCRHGHYGQARTWFAMNLWRHRKSGGELGFYAWQGLAFYQYFCAKFVDSEKAALSSLAQASVAQMQYGRTLALDIMGHALVQQGKISAGLSRLNDARSSADLLENAGLSHSIAISQLVYRAQYALSPEKSLKELQGARKKLDPQNSYAQANLLLELANQLLIRGQVKEASQVLSDASVLIYGSQHRRYAQLLALRLAEVAFRRGEFAQALSAVQMQRSTLDPVYDRLHLLMALGQELKILKAMNLEAMTGPLQAQMLQLTKATARAISLQMADRQTGKMNSEIVEDKIALLLSKSKNPESRWEILESKYLGFTYEVLGLPPGSCWILIVRDGFLILERGQVTHENLRLPDQLLRILFSLSKGTKTKEDLVREVWGYAYHPLRHDPMIYQAIARLREAFGKNSHLIEVSGEGYGLQKDFQFRSLLPVSISDEKSSDKDPQLRQAEVRSAGFARPMELNARQMKILSLLRKNEFLGVREIRRHFCVSSMTLKRDFAGLAAGGWVVKLGRARATRYTLPKFKE